MAAELGATPSRMLNRLAYDIANAEHSADIGVVAATDRIPIYDVSGEIMGYTTAGALLTVQVGVVIEASFATGDVTAVFDGHSMAVEISAGKTALIGLTNYGMTAFEFALKLAAPVTSGSLVITYGGDGASRTALILASAIQVNEAYSSQTCPVCGERNKCGRVYRCRNCGCTAPRDVIGGTNILGIGRDGSMVPGRSVPNAVHWVYPTK